MSEIPIRSRSFTLDGRRVGWLDGGRGAPLILVHGLGLNAGVWRPHIHVLGRRFRCIAPNLPGFGDSEGAATSLSVPETMNWLRRFASAVGIGRAAWVGHSISTQPLIELAGVHPDRVAALVLAAPTVRSGSRLPPQLLGLTRTTFRERPRVVLGVARRYFAAPLVTLSTWLRASRHDPIPGAAAVLAPALVVIGTDDPVVPREDAELLLARLPLGRLTAIEGAAHAVALDPVEPFCRATREFLEECYLGGPSAPSRESPGLEAP